MLVSSINALNGCRKSFDLTVTNKANKTYKFSNQNCTRLSFENIQAYNTNINFKGQTIPLEKFKDFAVNEMHPLWEKLIAREIELGTKTKDFRSIFKRDYDRILNSGAFSRTAQKTQVFSNSPSDMTSTRITHVNQVASVAEDIAEALGLNIKLTRAIAIGHDIGHAPFGHAGENEINAIMKKHSIHPQYWKEGFYHEKNGMRFADDIETLLDENGNHKNLNLTYAVRDGIVSHCGEVDENGLKPRTEYIDLRTIQKNNRPQPFTWEGCVVKIADKISYLGKDIEDALDNNFLEPKDLNSLKMMIKDSTGEDFKEINNTNLINKFISDLIENSSPEEGLKFSDKTLALINTVKKFNYEHIYYPNNTLQDRQHKIVLNGIFDKLNELYDGRNTLKKLDEIKETQPTLSNVFKDWLIKYSDIAPQEKNTRKFNNKTIYSIENQDDYKLSIIEFMSGMTNRFANKAYSEIVS